MATTAGYMTTPKIKAAPKPPPGQTMSTAVMPSTALGKGPTIPPGGIPPSTVGSQPWKPGTAPPAMAPPTSKSIIPGKPLSGTTGTTPYPGAQPGNWNPMLPKPNPVAPGQQAVRDTATMDFFKNAPEIWKPGQYAKPDEVMPNYIAATLPLLQLNQNALQYSQDYNEAQRRYNAEFGQTQGRDDYQRQLSTQQQKMAEWQAQQAATQFGQQLDWTKQTDMWTNNIANQQLGLQGREVDNQTFEGQTNRAGQQSLAQFQQGQIGIGQQQNQIDQMYKSGQLSQAQYDGATQRLQQQDTGRFQQGQIGVAQQQNQIDQMYKSGQLSQAQYDGATQRLQTQNLGTYQQGDLANDAYANRWDAKFQQGQLGIGQQTNSIDQMWKSGQLTNEQRNLALSELTQSQNNQFLNTQLAQQAQYERENQLKMANVNAFGRSRAPQTNWARSWG